MIRQPLFIGTLTLALAAPCFAQSATQDSGATKTAPAQAVDEQTARDRRYALDLYQQGKFLEALPWFEKVVIALPNDPLIRENYGSCLIAKAATLSDAAQRKATRIQARQQFLKAKELGDHSDYLSVALAGVPEDGRDPQYSSNAEVDRLMRQAEAAFAAGNVDDAKKSYLEALVIDPNNYGALLFMGDVYFRKGDVTAAGEWFSRAITVDPNHETAYRYWGDALLKAGKTAEAREKYIDGVLCDPYDQGSWAGINRYLKTTNQNPTWYKIKPPNSSLTNDSSKKTTINIDVSSLGKKDGSSAWIAYPMERALWRNEEFAKEFPNEKQYRHTLKEESAALSVVASTAAELSTGKKAEKLNADLEALVKLKKGGFLDAYILINVPDQGIVKDYPEYRKAHRDVLVQYLNTVVLPAATADAAP